MNLNEYLEDPYKQEQGSPCYLGDGAFYVKRIHTPEYIKQIEEIKNAIYGFTSKDMDQNLIVAHWLAEYGVTDWDGVNNPDDSELKFSRANARKVFLNPGQFMSLNSLLINHASSYANYLFDAVEEDVTQVKKS